MKTWTWWCALSALALSASCTSETSESGEAAIAPSDAVVVLDVHEPLQSAALRQQLCDTIARDGNWGSDQQRDAFTAGCDGYVYTVTAKSVSRLLAAAETCEPTTMALDVTVDADARTFQGRLARALGADFQLSWRATVRIPTTDHDALIRAIAEAGGEYFRVEEPPYEDNVREANWSAVPAAFRQIVDEKLADENAAQQEDGGSVYLSDSLYELVDDAGQRIGWVVPMEFAIDDPLFDGGGLYLFYNQAGDLLVENTWWG